MQLWKWLITNIHKWNWTQTETVTKAETDPAKAGLDVAKIAGYESSRDTKQ